MNEHIFNKLTDEERELYIKETARNQEETRLRTQVVSIGEAQKLLQCKYHSLFQYRRDYLNGAKIVTLADIETIIKMRKA